MKNRRWALLTLLLFLVNLFPLGCWDYQEVDETAYVLVLGFDKGKENKLTVTAQIAAPRRIAGGGAGGMPSQEGGPAGAKTTEVVTAEAPTAVASFNMLNTFVNRRISMKHTKVVVFSEELAREGLLPFLRVIGRYPEFRRNIFIGVARGVSARELLEKNQPVLEINPSKYVELATLASKYTGLSMTQPFLNRYYNAVYSLGSEPAAIMWGLKRQTPPGEGTPIQHPYGWRSEGDYLSGAIPRSGGNPVEQIGSALFKGDKMVGEITGDQTTAMVMMRNQLNQSLYSLPDPLEPQLVDMVSILQRRPPKFKIDVSEPVPKISIQIPLEGYVEGIQGHSNYEDPSFRPILEEAVAERITRDVVGLLQKTQALGIDTLGIGTRAKVHFLTWQEWVDYNWNEVYPQASIDVKVIVNLHSFGLLRKNAEEPARK
ncbi:MAG: Ger(x)C family spore germination protein [Firmicutes bacterium]|nr:Ger(x)C family spore germination protein [Bacillota bacterium]